jgi:DNA-binding CsgD family transcriptional regulator
MTALTGVAAGRGYVAHAGVLARLPPGGQAPLLDPAEVAALSALLEEIPSPAFVVWADGRIACANRLGRAIREGAPDSIESDLAKSLGGRGDAHRITRILAPGAPSHFLAVQAGEAVDPGPRFAAASARFGFTPRQAQVVGLLGLGRSNKAIASELGCAEATVEIHVTALLGKSGCQSRCELMSRIWSEPISPGGCVAPGGLRRLG